VIKKIEVTFTKVCALLALLLGASLSFYLDLAIPFEIGAATMAAILTNREYQMRKKNGNQQE